MRFCRTLFYMLYYQVSAARAPAEGGVCAIVRSATPDCVRQILPLLIARIAREPSPAALPHALLQRMALHHVVELTFDEEMLGVCLHCIFCFALVDIYFTSKTLPFLNPYKLML